ncbi:MAG TPA: polysaccharide biosynthesis/export family protein, partial [Pirellulales bacterium]|nr:polysaccharide biosynthesis/export family protein [Pirellulales bacterium]
MSTSNTMAAPKLCALPALAALLSVMCGCTTLTTNSIPAPRLPAHLAPESRAAKLPIDLTLLRQQPPKHYVVGPRDTLGIYIPGVLPLEKDTNLNTIQAVVPPIAYVGIFPNREQYPSQGPIVSPSVGIPLTVTDDGTLLLPLIDPLPVAGKTLQQIVEDIRAVYTQKQILSQSAARIIVSLIKPRTHRVLVVRQDSALDNPTQTSVLAKFVTKRGQARIIDLPEYENDVLHALITTDGLPGLDAQNEVWVLRSRDVDTEQIGSAVERIEAGEDPNIVLTKVKAERRHTRIPLRVTPGQPLPFSNQDVILENGDVVVVWGRETEFYFTGGLLTGGQIPLPRDYDLDVLGAISLANGAVHGLSGGNAPTALRGAVGSVIPPTRAIIIRTLPNGEQMKIRV